MPLILATLGGQESEGDDVLRADDREVAAVQSGDLGGAQPFGQRNHARVD
jgi:hypothetical protein